MSQQSMPVPGMSRDWRIVWQEHPAETGLVSVCRRFSCTIFQLSNAETGGVVFEWCVFTLDQRFLMASLAPSLVAAMTDCETFCRQAASVETAENTG